MKLVSLRLFHSDPLVASLTEQAGHGLGGVAPMRLREDASQLLAWLSKGALELLPQLLVLKRERSRWSVWDDGNACFGLRENGSSDLTTRFGTSVLKPYLKEMFC